MTTIIGLEYADSCIIVADSRVTDDAGYIYTHPDIKKITERNEYLISGSGEVLPCDVAQHIWEPPAVSKSDRKDLFHFMVAKAMPSPASTICKVRLNLHFFQTSPAFDNSDFR